jgi:general secretion pathway protein G
MITTYQMLSRRPSGRRAFTLIELIGVLAIIGLLVGIIAPSVIGRVNRAASTKEAADMQVIADSYKQYILRNKTIPGTNTWHTAIASEMDLSVSAITANKRGYARAFLVDPNSNINPAGGPYSQNANNGTTKPVNARVIIVSSLNRALPVSTGVPSSSDFNAIWNTAEGSTPAMAGNWGSSDELYITRVNLEPLFHQLILVDRDPLKPALFSIDTNAPAAGGLVWNRYYLDGTVVGLYDSTTQLQTRHRLKRSISFVFDPGGWSGQPGGTPTYSGTGAEYADHAMQFLNSPVNPYAISGGTQRGVLIAMYTFMFDYSLWANECPYHFDWHGQTGSNPQSVPEYILLNNQGQNNGNIDKFSKNLIAVPP